MALVSNHNLASSGTDALVTSTAEDEEPPEEHEQLETEFDYSVPTREELKIAAANWRTSEFGSEPTTSDLYNVCLALRYQRTAPKGSSVSLVVGVGWLVCISGVIDKGRRPAARRRRRRVRRREQRSRARERVVANFWQNFGKFSLVFGCIGADLCK